MKRRYKVRFVGEYVVKAKSVKEAKAIVFANLDGLAQTDEDFFGEGTHIDVQWADDLGKDRA